MGVFRFAALTICIALFMCAGRCVCCDGSGGGGGGGGGEKCIFVHPVKHDGYIRAVGEWGRYVCVSGMGGGGGGGTAYRNGESDESVCCSPLDVDLCIDVLYYMYCLLAMLGVHVSRHNRGFCILHETRAVLLVACWQALVPTLSVAG